MKKIISCLLLTSILTHSLDAKANTPPFPEQDPGEVVAPLKAGQSAPFSGVLMSPRATAKMISELSGINEKIALEISRATGELSAKHKFELTEADIKCTKDKKVLQATIDLKTEETVSKSAEIEKLRSDIIKKDAETPSRLVWSGIGTAGGVVLTILTVFAVNKATK